MPCLFAPLAAARDHLLRYNLSGCPQSGRHAAYLLDHLALEAGSGTGLGTLCARIDETLADEGGDGSWAHGRGVVRPFLPLSELPS